VETESDITVRHNADGHRYELLDGDAVIGEAHYLPFDGADGKTIVPVCPYIKSWLGKHDDYQPHATAVRPTHLQALSGMNR